MQYHSIRTMIATSSAICLLSVVVIMVIYTAVTAANTNQVVQQKVSDNLGATAQQLIEQTARFQAERVSEAINIPLESSRSLANTFELVAEGTLPLDRNQSNAILKSQLKHHDSFLGIYTLWEPNAFDNQDQLFRGDTATGSDQSGRFTPYWSRDPNGNIAVESLEGYEDSSRPDGGDRVGEYYLCPKEQRVECVINPYAYLVQGQSTLITSMVVPILDHGQFRGIIGVDMALSFLQKMATDTAASLYDGQAQVTVISNSGGIAAHSHDANLVGKPLNRLISSGTTNIIRIIQQGVTETLMDDATADIRVLVPIHMGHTSTPWSLMIQVPESVVLADVTKLNEALQARSSSDTRNQILLAILALTAGIIFSYALAGRVSKPVIQVSNLLREVAKGDLTQRIDIDSKTEVGTLATSCNILLEQFQSLIGQVVHASSQVSSASEQLNVTFGKTSQDLASQGAKTEEIASAIHELTQSANEIATNTLTASNVTEQATDAAESGRSLTQTTAESIQQLATEVESTASVISQLKESGDEISSIVGVINEIADQTNLLALNAAIEAARAGEHGRGFAVVADEVRTLAQKTQSATQEIQAMIDKLHLGTNSAVSSMDQGKEQASQSVEQAEAAGQALQDILQAISQMLDMNLQIASASEQQHSVTEEIGKTIEQIKQMADSVVVGASEALAACDSLTDTASNLHSSVQTFKV